MTTYPIQPNNRVRALRSVNDIVQLDRVARDTKFGPEPENPFRTLRGDLTLAALASMAHVDRKVLSRLEKGMYVQPSPSVVDYWVNRRHLVTEGELWADYENYQYLQRRRHMFYFGPSLITTPNHTHPFRRLRANRPTAHDLDVILPVGITECCEALCLPLDTIQFFEKKFRLQQSVPKILKQVLSQIGYTREQIAQFEKEYLAWRKDNKSVTSHG
jgi:transcriptional regulator with XRE-family HTH domain